MQKKLTPLVIVLALLSPGLLWADTPAKPTDPQIAHIAYTAGLIDVEAGKLALEKSQNTDVRAFAQRMVGDHTAVNDQALALVKKLNVTPEDNPTSQSLTKQAETTRKKLAGLTGAAFDKAYIDNEVAFHKTVNSALSTTLIPDAQNSELKSSLAEWPQSVRGASGARGASGSATVFGEVVVCGRRSNQAIRVEGMLKRNNSDYARLSDGELASRIAARDVAAVRLVTGRNNQRLFRTAWSILKDRSEAEEAVQDGYLKAFDAIETFAGRSSLSTWLTRIVVNEALSRRSRAQRRSRLLNQESVVVLEEYREKLMAGSVTQSPEKVLMRRQIAKLLETAIARLPDTFRPVFVLREIEGLSVEDTAEALQIPEETVKTRLFRARRRLQKELDPELCGALSETFPFAGADCEALTNRVLASFSKSTKGI